METGEELAGHSREDVDCFLGNLEDTEGELGKENVQHSSKTSNKEAIIPSGSSSKPDAASSYNTVRSALKPTSGKRTRTRKRCSELHCDKNSRGEGKCHEHRERCSELNCEKFEENAGDIMEE